MKNHSHLVTIMFFPHFLVESSLCFTDGHKSIRNIFSQYQILNPNPWQIYWKWLIFFFFNLNDRLCLSVTNIPYSDLITKFYLWQISLNLMKSKSIASTTITDFKAIFSKFSAVFHQLRWSVQSKQDYVWFVF